jgi:hypothetical protein
MSIFQCVSVFQKCNIGLGVFERKKHAWRKNIAETLAEVLQRTNTLTHWTRMRQKTVKSIGA